MNDGPVCRAFINWLVIASGGFNNSVFSLFTIYKLAEDVRAQRTCVFTYCTSGEIKVESHRCPSYTLNTTTSFNYYDVLKLAAVVLIAVMIRVSDCYQNLCVIKKTYRFKCYTRRNIQTPTVMLKPGQCSGSETVYHISMRFETQPFHRTCTSNVQETHGDHIALLRIRSYKREHYKSAFCVLFLFTPFTILIILCLLF